jgi:hypothetical protein
VGFFFFGGGSLMPTLINTILLKLAFPFFVSYGLIGSVIKVEIKMWRGVYHTRNFFQNF